MRVGRLKTWSRPDLTLTALTAVCFIGLVALIGWRVAEKRATASSRRELAMKVPRQDRPSDYVSSQRCQSCHPGEHASWHGTFHRTMTQRAEPDAVVGRFDGSRITAGGLEYCVYRKGDEFWAEMPDPDTLMYTVQGGKRIDSFTYWVKRDAQSPVEKLDLRTIPRVHRRVVMTTGSHHYQTYWVPGDAKFGNLLQTLPLVYLIRDQRWIPREAAFMYPPESTRMITQWNHHCIRCHSTGGVPGLSLETGGFETSVGELGIACEACHGPGDAHVRANHDPLRRYRLRLSGRGDSTIVNPSRLDHVASSQVCGQCHGVYIERDEFAMKYATHGGLYRPGDDLFRTRYYIQHPETDASAARQKDLERNPEFFRERWWDDGTILAGGREFTAMSASACYQRGKLSCLTCHTMHRGEPADQLRPDLQGNASCTSCHQQAKFTSDIASHTFHRADSVGSECLNCHMPHTSYALFGALRSHQILVPRVASSVRHGVPNACNLCHLDRTLEWTQQQLFNWYGTQPMALNDEQRQISAALLWLLKGDAAQRVIAAWHFGWDAAHQASGADWGAPLVAQLLADPYGVVRYVAFDALRKLPGMAALKYDFLGTKDQWQAARDQAVERWRSRANAVGRGAETLIDPTMGIDGKRVRALLEQRDNRPVSIKE